MFVVPHTIRPSDKSDNIQLSEKRQILVSPLARWLKNHFLNKKIPWQIMRWRWHYVHFIRQKTWSTLLRKLPDNGRQVENSWGHCRGTFNCVIFCHGCSVSCGLWSRIYGAKLKSQRRRPQHCILLNKRTRLNKHARWLLTNWLYLKNYWTDPNQIFST